MVPQVINTNINYKKLFDVGQREVILFCLFFLNVNKY